MDIALYEKGFSERLSRLRIGKGVSARDMSLSLGQSESYINKIENKRAFPSMTSFFYICDYLGITPTEFFDENINQPDAIRELSEAVAPLNLNQLRHLIDIARDISGV